MHLSGYHKKGPRRRCCGGPSLTDGRSRRDGDGGLFLVGLYELEGHFGMAVLEAVLHGGAGTEGHVDVLDVGLGELHAGTGGDGTHGGAEGAEEAEAHADVVAELVDDGLFYLGEAGEDVGLGHGGTVFYFLGNLVEGDGFYVKVLSEEDGCTGLGVLALTNVVFNHDRSPPLTPPFGGRTHIGVWSLG